MLYTLLVFTVSVVAISPIPSITVSCLGSLEGHYECGYQIGKQFKDRIELAFTEPGLLALAHRVEHDDLARRVFNDLVSTATLRYPRYVAELNGTAQGAGQPMRLVLVANLYQELATSLKVSGSASPFVRVPDACSDVLLVNNETAAFAHNEDYGTMYFDTVYFVRQRIWSNEGNDLEFATFAYPGILPGWAPGWNSNGLAISWNVMYPSKIHPGGVAVTFVCRDTLEAASIEDAIKRATPHDLALGQNLNVGSFKTQQLATVEIGPKGVNNVLHIAGPAYFHANEYLRLLPIPQFNDSIVSSQHRRATFRSLRAPSDIPSMLSVLGDTTDPKYPIFRRNDTTHEDTLFTIAFDLAEKSVSLYRDNPVHLQSLLFKEPAL